MMNHNHIPVENWPGTIDCLLIGSCKNDNTLCCGLDRSAEILANLNAVMRITRPVGCGGVSIGWIYQIVCGRLNRSLEDEVSISDAKIDGSRVTRNLCR